MADLSKSNLSFEFNLISITMCAGILDLVTKKVAFEKLVAQLYYGQTISDSA